MDYMGMTLNVTQQSALVKKLIILFSFSVLGMIISKSTPQAQPYQGNTGHSQTSVAC